MALREPESMDECIYFTQRQLGEKGTIKAWAYRGDCPACGKAKMGKPRDPKTGKVKIRAAEYVCPDCGHEVEKKEYEETLTCEAKYTCPACKKEGEGSVPFKRKKVQLINPETGKKKPVDAVQFVCEHCGEKLNVTKKMK